MASEEEILEARRKRAEQLVQAGEELFPARVPAGLDSIPVLWRQYGKVAADRLEAEPHDACIAGRIMGIRSFGKAAFVSLQGEGERLQIWMKRDAVGKERYPVFKLFEVGDFMWARGPLVRTKKGELSVDARQFGFLAKAYRPLPEKWHGLVDVERRYRQRYLDLLVNPESRALALARSRTTTAIRRALDERDFVEVETPVLQPIYGGAAARPFTTTHNTYDQDLFLRISFELYLKRLIIGGIDRVYEIGRDFRNEGISKKHNPEFTMLEVYQAYADYSDMMDLVETLVATAAERVVGTTRIERNAREIDLEPPWPRRTMTQLVFDACGIDIERDHTLESLRQAVRDKRVPEVDPATFATWAGLVDAVFSVTVEPGLIDPTFVLGYPVELSPLAKRSADRPDFVERFEAFVGGMEIANAFSELNDPDDQRERFQAQVAAASAGDDEAHPIDEDFLRALEHGMPPSGGMGMGIGRLTMVLTGATHLREVKLFPHLRPRNV